MPIESAGESLQTQSASVTPSAQGSRADPARLPFVLPSPFAEVAAGTILGVSIPPIIGRKTDSVQEFVVSNLDEIMASGVEMHETNDAITILYNPQKVTPEQIEEADKAGKLLKLFPLATHISYPRLQA